MASTFLEISFPGSLSVNLQFTWYKQDGFTYPVITNERMSCM